MTVKYEFENKECLTFIQCSDEEKIKIINAKIEKRCERMNQGEGIWRREDIKTFSMDCIYRTLKPIPTPNQIDWSLVPEGYKYCFFVMGSLYVITDRLPVEYQTHMDYRSEGSYKIIEEGDYGFKRGTVESLDSLLVRPVGE